MERIKRLIRVNTLALNFQSVYSILLDQYFAVTDDSISISIPFLNLIYITYPDIIIKLFKNNVPVIYMYLLRLKTNLTEDCIMLYPDTLVESVRIHLERIDVNDVFKLSIHNDLLRELITRESVDSMLSPSIDINSLDLVPPMPVSFNHMNKSRATAVTNFLSGSNKLKYIPLDTPMTNIDILHYMLIPNVNESILPDIQDWVKNVRTFLTNTIQGRATQLDYDKAIGINAHPIDNNFNSLLVRTLQDLTISRKLLHNMFLFLCTVNSNDVYSNLYKAFGMYPHIRAITDMKPKIVFERLLDKNQNIVLERVADVRLFKDALSAVSYYRDILTGTPKVNVEDFGGVDFSIARTSEEYIKYSMLEQIPKQYKVPTNILSHNTAQLAKKLSNIIPKPYYDANMNVTNNPVIDASMLSSLINNKIALVPPELVYNSLEETLEYYLPLIPETNVTAILLLLLYNSSNYMRWISIYKKHSETMLVIINRSTILSSIEKDILRSAIF